MMHVSYSLFIVIGLVLQFDDQQCSRKYSYRTEVVWWGYQRVGQNKKTCSF
jgi:hypothetical protein